MKTLSKNLEITKLYIIYLRIEGNSTCTNYNLQYKQKIKCNKK